MNKIKIIYNAARKMKNKDSIKGTFKAEGLKDQEKIFDLNNTFERNTQDGQIKGKTIIEADCGGKKIRLENSMDFQGEGCMHPFHKHHQAAHAGCMKDRFCRITAVLGILSSIRLEEQEDGSAILSLESADIPEEIKSDIHEKMKHGHEHCKHMDGNHQCHMLMKEFHDIENPDFTLSVFISKEGEIEKVIINVNGEQQDEKDQRHDMKLAAELSLEG